MRSLLPQPETLNKISLMYGLNKFFVSKRGLIGSSFSIGSYLERMKNETIFVPSCVAYDRLNLYFLNRSMHQLNEACNKLWATLEVHHGVRSKEKLCKKFSADFLPSSTVPTLHYANVSALLSILSLFGLSSIAQRERKLIFYNLVRTADGVILEKRNKYLSDVFGFVKSGWHTQILQIYEGLRQKGIMLPDIDLLECKRLQRERAKFHYDILGQTSMKGASGEVYFQFLPFVASSIEVAIDSIHQVIKPIPNACDLRFEDMRDKMPQVMQEFEKTEHSFNSRAQKRNRG